MEEAQLQIWSGRLNRTARLMAGAIIAVGLAVLAGWLAQAPLLVRLGPGLAPLEVNGAVAFILGGGALLLLAINPQSATVLRVARGLAVSCLMLGLLCVGEDLLGWNYGLNDLLAGDWRPDAQTTPGHLSLVGSLGMVTSGLALLLLGLGHYRHLIAQALAFAVGLIGLLGLLGHAFDAEAFYEI